jgi:4-hydroxy-3-polyprenylbenzoate decarboxylase
VGISPSNEPPIVIGITGASGGAIAIRTLEALKEARRPVVLVLSAGGRAVLQEECGLAPQDLAHLADQVYADGDLAAPIASGSHRTRAMVVVPCSANTVSKIALGLGDTLITRAAHVHLKERRPLIVVPRETPLSAIILRNLTTLAENGVVVLMAAPPFYLRPTSIGDLVDFLAGKVLDHLGVPHHLYRGWKEGGG